MINCWPLCIFRFSVRFEFVCLFILLIFIWRLQYYIIQIDSRTSGYVDIWTNTYCNMLNSWQRWYSRTLLQLRTNKCCLRQWYNEVFNNGWWYQSVYIPGIVDLKTVVAFINQMMKRKYQIYAFWYNVC